MNLGVFYIHMNYFGSSHQGMNKDDEENDQIVMLESFNFFRLGRERRAEKDLKVCCSCKTK